MTEARLFGETFYCINFGSNTFVGMYWLLDSAIMQSVHPKSFDELFLMVFATNRLQMEKPGM